MPTFTCPNCKEDDAEIADRRKVETGGVVYSFECPSCDHTWNVTL